MISIVNKNICCGCYACAQICPRQCIVMKEDSEGFSYPQIDKLKCIDCKLCEEVCPMVNQIEGGNSLQTYAARNRDEKIREESSSGGVFSLLAEFIIKQGGVVFGAKFNDNWEVIHDYTENIEGLSAFRGSKYVQSKILDNFIKVKKNLKDGRNVLFSGTPCQIAGLRTYLRKDYDNLFLIDIICHGVPSPLVWREYIKYVLGKESERDSIVLSPKDISKISFRDKTKGWKKYKFVLIGKSVLKFSKDTKMCFSKNVILDETFDKNLFMQGFLSNQFLRPSCYSCKFKSGRSGSDITIGDFWGIENYYPDFDDDNGASSIIINSDKGLNLYKNIDVESIKCSYGEISAANPCLKQSVSKSKYVDYFWKRFNCNGIEAINDIFVKMKSSKVHLWLYILKTKFFDVIRK